MGDAVISCDDCSSVVDDPDCIENALVDECWVDFGCFLLGTDNECAKASESIVVDCCNGRMCNASVTNLVSGGAVFSAILVVQRLRRAGRTSVNHITRFYLREISFLTNFFRFTYCIRRIILVVLSCFFARTNIVKLIHDIFNIWYNKWYI